MTAEGPVGWGQRQRGSQTLPVPLWSFKIVLQQQLVCGFKHKAQMPELNGGTVGVCVELYPVNTSPTGFRVSSQANGFLSCQGGRGGGVTQNTVRADSKKKKKNCNKGIFIIFLPEQSNMADRESVSLSITVLLVLASVSCRAGSLEQPLTPPE